MGPAKALAITTLLVFLLPAQCGAAEIIPYRRNDSLGVHIRDIGFPETLRKDLVSGLTNRILIRIVLTEEVRSVAEASVAEKSAAPIAERRMSIEIKYDLWEETFNLSVFAHDAADAEARAAITTQQQFAKVEETLAYLANLDFPGLFSTAALPQQQRFVWKAEVLLNPIDRERMEKIRKWVAQNSTYSATGGGGFRSVSPSGSASATLFNQIFEQYAAGADIAAAWRETIVSPPFGAEDPASR